MRLSQSSSIFNSLYIFMVDVVLVLFVSKLVQIFISSANMKAIYEERKPLYLQLARIPTLTTHGLAGRKTLWATIVLSTTILGLAIAGSFSIDGVSHTGTATRKVPFLVDLASAGNRIDFMKHVSIEHDKVSGIFVLLKSSLDCYKKENLDLVLFSSFGNIHDPFSVTWPLRGFRFANVSCLIVEDGFVEKAAIRKQEISPLPHVSHCNTTYLWNESGQMKRGLAVVNQSCPYRPIETWCYSQRTTFCVSTAKIGQVFTILTAERKNDGSRSAQLRFSGSTFVYSLASRKKAEAEELKSIAFLLSTDSLAESHAIEMASMTVYEDASVTEYTDVIKETEINLLLLGATLGTSLILTVIFAALTYLSWIKYVCSARRKNYNFFHTETDMISLVINEVLNDGRCRFKRKEQFILAVDNGQPKFMSSPY